MIPSRRSGASVPIAALNLSKDGAPPRADLRRRVRCVLADGLKRAARALGRACVADAPPERQEVDVEGVGLARPDEGLDDVVGLVSTGLLGDQAQPSGDPVHVRIHGEDVPPAREHQDATRGLAPHALLGLQKRENVLVRHLVHRVEGKLPKRPLTHRRIA